MWKRKHVFNHSRVGFTLIELIVVVSLLSAVVAIGTVSLRGPYRNARREHEQARLAHWLQLVRNHARRTQSRGEIEIDVTKNVMRYESSESRKQLSPLYLSSLLPLKEIKVANSFVNDRDARIPITSAGTTNTFALCFGRSEREEQWLLISGGSGQLIWITKREEIENAMRLLATGAHSR